MKAAFAATAVLFAVPLQLPGRATSLPRAGIAVQTAQGVVLADPSGGVRTTLSGYRIRTPGVERPGQVELRDSAGNDWELRAGRLARVEKNSITLPYGWSLRLDSGWTLRQGGRVVDRFAPGTHLELDASGSVLSAVPPGGLRTLVRNLQSGTVSSLPPGCRVGARIGLTNYELCGSPFPVRKPSTVVRGERNLAGPVASPGGWRQILPGPSGEPLLAQWTGACAATRAYLLDRRTGKLVPLRDRTGRAVPGQVLGWVGATPLVALPQSRCPSAATPGVYAYDATEQPLLVLRLPASPTAVVRFWD